MRPSPTFLISRRLFVPSLSHLILGFLICMPMYAGAVRTAWADLVFAPHADYSTPGAPQSIVSGDFNRDRHPDLAVANFTGSVSIFMNNGDGTFQPGQDYGTGAQPRSNPFPVESSSLTTADLNGDGILDLAVANSASNTVSVLFGNGDGTFQTSMSFGTGANPTSVAISDWNGDGRLDLAVANSTDNTVSVLLGNSTGGFGVRRDVATGTNPVSVAVGDVNGDRVQDLITSNAGADIFSGGANSVSVLLGNGDGAFRAKTDYPAGVNPRFVAIADLNRDGVLDLAVADTGDHSGTTEGISILLGNGNGTFQSGVHFGAVPQPTALAIGDLDGDGILDLAVAMFGGIAVNVFLGNGDGTFQYARTPTTGEAESSLSIADLDGDGALDLAVTNYQDLNLSILIQVPAAARAFTTTPYRTIRLESDRASWCAQIEPVGGSFLVTEVLANTIVMKYGSGSIAAVLGKRAVTADTDGNGIQELTACFAKADLRALFAGLPNRTNSVPVTLEGNLGSGGKCRARLTIDVVSKGTGLVAHVSPNPLNPEATLGFTISRPGFAKASIFDVSGRTVRVLLDEPSLPAGYHALRIDGRGEARERLGSGVYFYRVESEEGTATGRFAILR